MCIYSALSLLAVHSIYISTLGFLLAMPVRKGFKARLMCGTCVAHAVPCISSEGFWKFLASNICQIFDTVSPLTFKISGLELKKKVPLDTTHRLLCILLRIHPWSIAEVPCKHSKKHPSFFGPF